MSVETVYRCDICKKRIRYGDVTTVKLNSLFRRHGEETKFICLPCNQLVEFLFICGEVKNAQLCKALQIKESSLVGDA